MNLPLQTIQILEFEGHFFCRVQSGEHWGVAALNHWTPALLSVFQTVVAPFFGGKNAQQIEEDVEAIYRHGSNYKLAGMPFWSCVGALELAVWDLRGRAQNQNVAALFSPHFRREIPIYLSSLRRDTSPEAEVGWLSEKLTQTGTRAAKIKLGARMKRTLQSDRRDQKLLQLARQTWGDDFTLYADANGSFSMEEALQKAPELAHYGVAWFEEPCAWEDREALPELRELWALEGLKLPIAAGEQDSSFWAWEWFFKHGALDIAQPDVQYNGGLCRTLRVAKMATQGGVLVAPHSPKTGPHALGALQLAALVENPAPHLEWRGENPSSPSWFATDLTVRNGAVTLPLSPGLGGQYDPDIWPRAQVLSALS